MRLTVGAILLAVVWLLGCGKQQPSSTAESSPGAAKEDDTAKEEAAKTQAYQLYLQAQQHYRSTGLWPRKIEDFRALLKDGEKGLIDPWGKEYQFKVVKTKDQAGSETEKFYVWTERLVGSETKVFGAKPPIEK